MLCLSCMPVLNSVHVSFPGESDGQHHALPCAVVVESHLDPCSPLFPVLGPAHDVLNQFHKLSVLWPLGQTGAGRRHTGNCGMYETLRKGSSNCLFCATCCVTHDNSPVLESCFLFPYSAGGQESETGCTGLKSGCQRGCSLRTYALGVRLQTPRPSELDEAVSGRRPCSYHNTYCVIPGAQGLRMGKGRCIDALKFATFRRCHVTRIPAFPVFPSLEMGWKGRI